ncbi:hypothetical protein RHOSPDRAFT_25976 [Rhodotorula sp. JG-1b]|nr:hypothetical protein RHOSPDRAFT_25976 [Rhodotorula sp. JG-1b]
MSDVDELEYDYDYVDPVPAALECPICRCALVEPVKTPDCDHLFCRRCLQKSLALAPKCPIDRSPLPRGIQSCTPPHRALVQLVGDLAVNYQGRTVTRDEADRLIATARRNPAARAAPSPDSSQVGTHTANHPGQEEPPRHDSQQNTPEAAPCEHCTLVLPLASHPSHLLSTCTVIPRPCPHASRGCPYTGPRALLEQDHLPSECAYEPLSAYFDRTDQQVLQLENENWQLRQRVQVAEERLHRLAKVMEALTASLGEFAPPGLSDVGSLVGGGDRDLDRDRSPATALARPAPTKRTSSSSSSHSTGDLPPPSSSPSLVSTLSHLRHHTSHLSSSLSSLAQSHSHQLGTTLALSEDVASLRTQLTGVRIQMGNVMRDVYHGGGAGGGGGGGGAASRSHCSSFAGGPAAFSLARGGGGGGGAGLRVPPPPGRAHANGGGGSSGSSEDDDNEDPYHHRQRPPPLLRHNPNEEVSTNYYYEDDPSYYCPSHHPQLHAHAMPPRLPMGMRAVNLPPGGGTGMGIHGGLPLGSGHGLGQNGGGGGGGGGAGGGLVKL